MNKLKSDYEPGASLIINLTKLMGRYKLTSNFWKYYIDMKNKTKTIKAHLEAVFSVLNSPIIVIIFWIHFEILSKAQFYFNAPKKCTMLPAQHN